MSPWTEGMKQKKVAGAALGDMSSGTTEAVRDAGAMESRA